MDKKFISEVEEYVIDLRRWFHQHPELSNKEIESSKKIQDELTAMGITFELLPPSYGIVATIKGDIPSDKKIGLRADFDALPLQEDTGLDFSSVNPGIMHACGHDAHAAMLLGAAKILIANKSSLAGTVKLLFQGAEEAGFGIAEIIDYIDQDGGIDEVVGIHIWSAIESGEILLKPESIFAGAGEVFYKITGKGGHGARPDLVHDPVKAACDLIMHLSSIPSNFHNVLDNAVVTTCKISSGDFANIFPMEAVVQGTYRYFKPDSNHALRSTIERMAKGIALIHNVKIESTTSSVKDLPPVYNDPAMIARARELVKDIDGLEISAQTDPISASDNYAKLLKKYKGIYAILGAKPASESFPQHHPKFDLDESSFIKGSQFMANYAMDFCK